MTSLRRLFLLTLLASILGAGYAYRHGQARQTELLHQFAVLDADLMANNQQNAQAAANTVRSISRITYLNYQSAADRSVLANSEQIFARTQSLTDTLRSLRSQLGAPASKARGLPNQEAACLELAAQVARYDNFIRRFDDYKRFGSPLETGGLARVFRQNLPPALLAATVASLETQVRNLSDAALQNQAEKMGTKCFICSQYMARAVPTSATVAPGALYQAQLFLEETPAADYGLVTMSANGQPLTVKREAGGLVEFPIPRRQPDQPDTLRVSWRGVIHAAYPTDTAWQLTVPYLIVQHPAP